MAKVELLVPITAVSGKAEELKRHLTALLAPTHAEPGNEFYRLYESETEGNFFFHELWKSQLDLDQHLQTPHFKQAEKAVQGLIQGSLAIHKVAEIS